MSSKPVKLAYLGWDNLLLEVQVEVLKDSMPVGVYQDLPRVDCPPFFFTIFTVFLTQISSSKSWFVFEKF